MLHTTTKGEVPEPGEEIPQISADESSHSPGTGLFQQVDAREEQFVSTPRGACLARQFAVRCLGGWGWPRESDISGNVALLVAELAANAVRHGRLAGREFHLRLALAAERRRIRIEVSDACPQRPPSVLRAAGPDDDPAADSSWSG